ncbi:protein O-mannosyl-transferase 2 [Trichonephila clavipes]|nr:protein O-mannosyl-transferase 2 [Trichonephila clavipes]
MLSAVILNYLLNVLGHILPEIMAKFIQHLVLGLTLACVVYSFILFSPLAYGMDNSAAANSSTSRIKWLDSWEF